MVKAMIKAIFFDIDGTLLTSRGRILESTKKAIKEAQAKNIYVGVATGRDPIKIKELLKDIQLDMIVAYNGQLVFAKDQIVYAHSFDEKVMEEIVYYADTHSRSMNFGGCNQVMGSRTMRLGQSLLARKFIKFLPERFPVGFMKKTLQKLNVYRGEKHYENLPIMQEPIYQCMMLSPESEMEKLKKELPNCDFQRSNRFSVDIVPKGGSKLRGINTFLYHKNIESSEAMAFGDHNNDIEMLRGVGYGVAMGNAKKDVKKIARYVTTSNNRDGISKAMRHFGVIK